MNLESIRLCFTYIGYRFFYVRCNLIHIGHSCHFEAPFKSVNYFNDIVKVYICKTSKKQSVYVILILSQNVVTRISS